MKFDKMILATNNQHKIAELKALLLDVPITVLSKADFPDFPEIEEQGATLADNAIHKARIVYQKYRLPSIADDTGLEVKYLKGAPGVFSARYAGEGCSFQDNMHKLLEELDGVDESQRGARFVTVIALCYEGGEYFSLGEVQGRITTEMRGGNGFGYDPIFYHPDSGKTFAEMTAGEKNAISHRGRALSKLKSWLIR